MLIEMWPITRPKPYPGNPRLNDDAVPATSSQRSREEQEQLSAIMQQSRQASSRLTELAVRCSQREVASPAEIQAAIPAQAAIVFWNDVDELSERVQEHWGCVVRNIGPPHWQRLPGTGSQQAWTNGDRLLAAKLREASAGRGSDDELAALAKLLREQRLHPLMPHLAGVKTLYVVAVDRMAGVPVELLAPQLTINYVPSGTFLARAKLRRVPQGNSLLALGDPVFEEKMTLPAASDLPPGGVLIPQVAPGGAAAAAQLRAGDVIVRYGDRDASSVQAITEAIAASEGKKTVPVSLWREGGAKAFVRTIPSGKLGATLSQVPAREAIVNRREADKLLVALRGDGWKELPGTRIEVAQIGKLFGTDRSEILVDSNASEQSLETIRQKGDLTKYRWLHFATHGQANNVMAFESALILSQDKLPKELQSRAGEPFLNGQLSAREVLEYWKLDADLVTLSACETAIGKSGGGDGLLGFAQAFLTAGSRSVLLSLYYFVGQFA